MVACRENLSWTWPMGSLTYPCLLFKLNRAVYTDRPSRLNARYTADDLSFTATPTFIRLSSFPRPMLDRVCIRVYTRVRNKVSGHKYGLVTNDREPDKVTRNKRCTAVVCVGQTACSRPPKNPTWCTNA